METQLTPGANVKKLRKDRGLSQLQLARKANISVSLLSKIEVGDRTLTPSAAASLGRAMGVTMAEVQGRAPIAHDEEAVIADLRKAIRDFDLPRVKPPTLGEIHAELERVDQLRDTAKITKLMPMLPLLLKKATSLAHAENSEESWAALADVYGSVYWMAARHRWMDLAELAVSRQRWAAGQKHNPLSEAVAARDRAGTYLNFGDCEGGLMVVERAISRAERALSGEERDIAVGLLNLRGMTLAGRLPDDKEARREANRHIQSARHASQPFTNDFKVHGLTFGPRNTFVHNLATLTDLGRPKKALGLTDDLETATSGLPPLRIAHTYIAAARAQLDVGDVSASLDSLYRAWNTAPQLARLNPMWQEVLRVIDSTHKRANPQLAVLRQASGIED
ncbi:MULTISPECIES: helix-turn-helix domain-containing protein [Streptomyces]|uniref:Helix-turn-helix n=1 Tax=Streptomyces aidingensis TaxID=910347 RepID=A0A1I1RH44_9ACTN|nr:MULTISPECIES: helix-turn-helix transcriptional regulator [Streptomyces]SFD33492.1 Helix-turn-helix [Streptomyces aidingensis]